MHPPRYSTSRQKACRQCATAKARCQRRHESGNCVRCAQRDLPCSYTSTQADPPKRSNWTDKDEEDGAVHPETPFSLSQSSFSWLERSGLLPESAADSDTRAQSQGLNIPRITVSASTPSDRSRNSEPAATSPASSSGSHDEVDFSVLDLVCTINADDIQNRWIQTYIPVPGQQVKNYTTAVARFIYRTLKSYAAAAVHGRGLLPFIHAKQIIARLPGSSLTTCLSLVRICANQIPGSEHGAASVLQREMQAVYEGRSMYNAEALFAAFQAYLIYAMVLFFWLNENTDRHFRDIMTNLQELACASARHGLVCAADQQRARPRWEEWIVAEAKRRTLFVMYLFDSVLSTQEGLPTFLGIELHGLPAPANKLLWQASNRYEWEREYNIHLVDWMEGSLTIDELWPTPPDLDENALARRADRADRWLENLDEYGTMFYAIMQCTHGG